MSACHYCGENAVWNVAHLLIYKTMTCCTGNLS